MDGYDRSNLKKMGRKSCTLITHDSAILLASMTAHGQQGQNFQHSSLQLKTEVINSTAMFSDLHTSNDTEGRGESPV